MSNIKKITLFIIIIVALIGIAIASIVISKNNEDTVDSTPKKAETSKLSKIYEKIKENQNFTFSMEEEKEELKYKVSMLQRGTDACIDVHSDGEHTTTLVLEKESYYIMHDEEEYYVFADEEVDSDILISGLEEMAQKDYTTGKEEINGKKYYYEEYDSDGYNFTIFADINENSKIKTRFYFDKDQLVYIKNIITENENQEEEIVKADISYEIDESLFELPENYAEVEG